MTIQQFVLLFAALWLAGTYVLMLAVGQPLAWVVALPFQLAIVRWKLWQLRDQ